MVKTTSQEHWLWKIDKIVIFQSHTSLPGAKPPKRITFSFCGHMTKKNVPPWYSHMFCWWNPRKPQLLGGLEDEWIIFPLTAKIEISSEFHRDNWWFYRDCTTWYTGWWFGTCFSILIGTVIIPTDELTPSFFRGVATTKQSWKIMAEISNAGKHHRTNY
jgi:hypothetical protein